MGQSSQGQAKQREAGNDSARQASRSLDGEDCDGQTQKSKAEPLPMIWWRLFFQEPRLMAGHRPEEGPHPTSATPESRDSP